MKSYDSINILYADNHIVVANKPGGLLTQPNLSLEPSLESLVKDWLKDKYEKKGNVFLHVIHRLDRPVSGLVLFARTTKALGRLNLKMKNKEIQRTYLAEVEGVLRPKEGCLDHYLVHGDHCALVVDAQHPEGKHARLFYKTLQEKQLSTVIEVNLETGRYHQIRAQMSAIGHPVSGDKKYGSSVHHGESIRLHSYKLAFEHPVTQEMVSLEAPPPFV